MKEKYKILAEKKTGKIFFLELYYLIIFAESELKSSLNSINFFHYKAIPTSLTGLSGTDQAKRLYIMISIMYINMSMVFKKRIQRNIMLETSEERIKLLKAGLTGKTIEKLYIENNNFKIVNTPMHIDLFEIDIPQKRNLCKRCEMAVEQARFLCPNMALLRYFSFFGRRPGQQTHT